MANSLDHDTLFPLLEALTIPSGYKDYNNALPDETAVLDEWSKRSVSVLNQVKVQLEKVDVKVRVERSITSGHVDQFPNTGMSGR